MSSQNQQTIIVYFRGGRVWEMEPAYESSYDKWRYNTKDGCRYWLSLQPLAQPSMIRLQRSTPKTDRITDEEIDIERIVFPNHGELFPKRYTPPFCRQEVQRKRREGR